MTTANPDSEATLAGLCRVWRRAVAHSDRRLWTWSKSSRSAISWHVAATALW